MSFVFTWNSAFLSAPADTENESLGAGRIRDFKNAITERLQVSFSLAGDQYDGQVLALQFKVQTSAPSAGNAQLFSMANSTSNQQELYYEDLSGNVTQLTNDGAVNVVSPIPSGTRMTFLQANVPVGWTHDASINDVVVRINGVSGGGTGGSWTLSGATTTGMLAQANLPNVNLPLTLLFNGGISASTGGTGTPALNSGSPSQIAGTFAKLNGGVTQTNTTLTITNDATWRPAYTDAVIGVKN